METDKSRPRLAATLAVVRDAPAGLEVLLLQRADKGDHNSLAWVFPGGLVDPGDRLAHAHSDGLDDMGASARLGVAEGGLDLFLAAIREAFEEAGLLFADAAAGIDVQQLSAQRNLLREGQLKLAQFCQQFALRLRPDRLHYIAHWLTPRGRTKRFDTRFFVAVLPEGQAAMQDDVETVQQVWLRPAQALAPENTRRLMTPTRSVLEGLGAFADTTALLAWAHSARQVQRVLPRLARGTAGPEPVLPGHPAWHEIGRLDPEGRATAAAALQPGALKIGIGVLRWTDPGSLAHSYLIDAGAEGWAVIDPGPDPEALIAAAPGPIRWIGVTDSDAQLIDNAARLQARSGAQAIGAQTPGALQALQALPGPLPGSTLYHLASACLLFTGAQEPSADGQRQLGETWAAARHGFLRPLAPPQETPS
jgi:8-oxo-dGTP pyrophosphatase MutT (NUDIX family)